ncbi:MAG: PA14 domain-containing protein, partial [Planctomycetota bacterium]|nr:PA14 domain-containing protein [Planctomycetota bacterium]
MFARTSVGAQPQHQKARNASRRGQRDGNGKLARRYLKARTLFLEALEDRTLLAAGLGPTQDFPGGESPHNLVGKGNVADVQLAPQNLDDRIVSVATTELYDARLPVDTSWLTSLGDPGMSLDTDAVAGSSQAEHPQTPGRPLAPGFVDSLFGGGLADLNPDLALLGNPTSASRTAADAAHGLQLVLINDMLPRAGEITQAVTDGATPVLYDGEKITIGGFVDLLADLSREHGNAPIEAVAIVTHGRPGALQLGANATLDLQSLVAHQAELQQLRGLLGPGAQFEFYACSLAGTTAGQVFLNEFSQVIDASVFASTNDVGSGELGDYTFEFSTSANAHSRTLISAAALEGIPELSLPDTTPPTFSSPRLNGVAPGTSSQVNLGQTLSFSGSVADNVGLAVLTVRISGPRGNDLTVATNNVSGTSQSLSPYSINTANTAYAGLPGNYTAAFFAKDTSNNVTPQTWNFTVSSATGGGAGVLATYFDNIDFSGGSITRTDATINFDWGGGSPSTSIGPDTFSARWGGQIQPRFSETYTFFTTSDDGVRLWINNQLVIDNWTDHASTVNSGAIALVAGQKYNMRMEYYENGGGAIAKLEWQSASQTREVVPQSQLYPDATAPQAPGGVAATDGSHADKVCVTWTASANTNAYEVWRNTSNNSGMAAKITSSDVIGTSYDDTAATPGATYWYWIKAKNANGTSGFSAADSGYRATVSEPGNNNFANRSTIIGATATATGTNVGATKESGEPNHAGITGGKSVWWTWTAPSTGSVQIDTIGSNFDTILGVYTGSSVSSLTAVSGGSDDDSGGNLTSQGTFNAVAGTTYQIAVDGYGVTSGNITLHVNQTSGPGNNNFANRASISGASVTITGTNVGATKESGEPNHAGNSGGKSVWWTWTAPST